MPSLASSVTVGGALRGSVWRAATCVVAGAAGPLAGGVWILSTARASGVTVSGALPAAGEVPGIGVAAGATATVVAVGGLAGAAAGREAGVTVRCETAGV